MVAGETPFRPVGPESWHLSNRRLFYEAVVTALRQSREVRTDAHRLQGETDVTGKFLIQDYFSGIELKDTRDSGLSNDELRNAVLEARRPPLTISTGMTDS